FPTRVQIYRALQACAQRDPACVQEWAQEYDLPYDYIYLRVPGGADAVPLGALLDKSTEYEIVYSAPTIKVYRWTAAGQANTPEGGLHHSIRHNGNEYEHEIQA
ncbi:MAG: hypothetical protein ACK2T0_10675, partial [Anaerolineales bacterium]